MEVGSRRIQGIVDAFASGSPGNPARVITGYKGADDAVAPNLRSWAAARTRRRSTWQLPELEYVIGEFPQ